MPSVDQKQMAETIKASISPVLGLIKSTASAGNLSVVTISPPSSGQTTPETEMDLVFMNSKTTITPSAPASTGNLVFLVNLTNSQLNLAANVKLSLSDPTNSLVLFLIDGTTGDVQSAMPPFQKSDSGPLTIGPNQMIGFSLASALSQGDIASVDIVARKPTMFTGTAATGTAATTIASNNNTLLSVGIGVTILIVLAVIGFFVFGKKTKAGFRRRRF